MNSTLPVEEQPPQTAVRPMDVPRAIPSARKSLVVRMAERLNVDADKLMDTLKATAFRQRPDKRTGEPREPTNEEMMALLILADTYHLNPFTKELFAYLDPKSGAIIPVVSVDGWIRIINDQPTLRSLSFRYSEETVKHKGKTCHVWMECEIVRSDRDKPIVIREYFAEVVREVDFSTPWDSHPNRLHRHKTLIQGARVAFGFGGIYDDDEANRIIEGESSRVPDPEVAPGIASINATVTGKSRPAIEHIPGETVPASGGQTVEAETVRATAEATDKKAEKVGAPTFATVAELVSRATTVDALNIATDLIRSVANAAHQRELNLAVADKRRELAKDDGK